MRFSMESHVITKPVTTSKLFMMPTDKMATPPCSLHEVQRRSSHASMSAITIPRRCIRIASSADRKGDARRAFKGVLREEELGDELRQHRDAGESSMLGTLARLASWKPLGHLPTGQVIASAAAAAPAAIMICSCTQQPHASGHLE